MSKILGMDGSPAGSSLEFNILDQPNIVCAECGDRVFELVNVLKRINKVLVGAPHDQIVPIQLFRCSSCGSLSSESLPDSSVLGKILGNE